MGPDLKQGGVGVERGRTQSGVGVSGVGTEVGREGGTGLDLKQGG